jgi:rhodanese-related sulfurtransferase
MNPMEVPRISIGEAKRRLDEGEAIVLVDVRMREAYDQSHIKGALSLPVKEAETRLHELPQGRLIICY